MIRHHRNSAVTATPDADGVPTPLKPRPTNDGVIVPNAGGSAEMAASVALAKVVFDLTQRLNDFSTAEELLDTVAVEMARLVPNDRLAIILSRNRGRDVDLRFSRGDALEFQSGQPRDSPDGRRLAALEEPLLYTLDPNGQFVGDGDRWASGFRQVAVAPLRTGSEQIGLFTLMSKRVDAFDESDLWILSSLAGALAMMLAATDMRLEAQQGQIEAEFVASLGSEAAAMRSEPALFDLVAKRLHEVFDCTVAIYRLHGDGIRMEAIEVAASLNPSAVRVLAMTLIDLSNSPLRAALNVPLTEAPYIVQVDADEPSDVNPLLLEEMRRRQVDALMATPIVWNGQHLGVVGVSQNRRHLGNPLIPWDRQAGILQRVSAAIGPILENITLHESLTRALNESELLRSILSDTTQRNDPVEGLDVVARAAHLLYSADYVAVGRTEGAQFVWRVQVGSRYPERSRVTLISPRLHLALEQLVPVLVRDFPNDPVIEDPALYPIHESEGLLASLTIPFEIDDGGTGILLVGHRRPHQFDAADIRFARSLGTAVAARLLGKTE